MNPYTYHLHAHIYQFFSEPYHLQHINEYQSISFHSPAALYLETMLLFGRICRGVVCGQAQRLRSAGSDCRLGAPGFVRRAEYPAVCDRRGAVCRASRL